MFRILASGALIVLALALPGLAADPAKCTAKAVAADPPKDLAAPIRDLLSNDSIQVLEGDKVVCQIWLRKEVAVKADDPKATLTYRMVPETTVIGAVEFAQKWTSFRKQEIKAGLFTMRLAFQPMDGDHMGTAPYSEFLLLSPAKNDQKAGTMEGKALHELSAKTIPGQSHPAVMLLFPNPKPEDAPKLVDKGAGNWALSWKAPAEVNKQKSSLGLGMILFGVTTAE